MWNTILTTLSAGNLVNLMPNIDEISGGEALNQQDLNAIEAYLSTMPEKLLNLGIRILIVAVLFLIGVQVIRLIRKIVRRSLARASVEVGSIHFIDSCVKVILYVFLIVMLAGNLGIDAASIVALMGSVALTIGLSLQGSLSNFAGGVLILICRTFKVGDYIVEGTGKNEGTVSEIGLFYTKLNTGDNKVVIVPNGSLANSTVINVTGMEDRRIDLNVAVSYQTEIGKAKKLLEELIKKDSRVKAEQEIEIFVNALNAASVELGVRFWVKKDDYWPVQWQFLESIKQTFEENEIKIPSSQLDVRML
ncbi:MAG: mechanosensitive ion channel [Lachnospiraceae bacterium]